MPGTDLPAIANKPLCCSAKLAGGKMRLHDVAIVRACAALPWLWEGFSDLPSSSRKLGVHDERSEPSSACETVGRTLVERVSEWECFLNGVALKGLDLPHGCKRLWQFAVLIITQFDTILEPSCYVE